VSVVDYTELDSENMYMSLSTVVLIGVDNAQSREWRTKSEATENGRSSIVRKHDYE
jgi:hypothetical protein